MKQFQLPPIVLLNRIDSRYMQKFLKNVSACSQNCSQFYIVVCISRSLLLASCKVMQYICIMYIEEAALARLSWSRNWLIYMTLWRRQFSVLVWKESLLHYCQLLLCTTQQYTCYIEYVTTKPPKPKTGGAQVAATAHIGKIC